MPMMIQVFGLPASFLNSAPRSAFAWATSAMAAAYSMVSQCNDGCSFWNEVGGCVAKWGEVGYSPFRVEANGPG